MPLPIPHAVKETLQHGIQPRFSLTEEQVRDLHIMPLPGRCILKLEPPEEKVGSIYVPEKFKSVLPLHAAVVLRVSPREDFELGFREGDRVLVELSLDDTKGRTVIIARNERIAAIL